MSTAESFYDPEFRGLYIVKRKNVTSTTYHLRWSRPQAKGVAQYIYLGKFGSPQRAKDARKRAKNLIEQGIAPTPAHFNGGLTLAAAPARKRLADEAERWFTEGLKTWTGKTPKVRRGYIRRVVGWFGADTDPEKINLAAAREFYDILLAEGMEPVSIRPLTSCIKGILDIAHVSNNPFRDPLLVRPSGRSEARPIPTKAACEAVKARLTGDYLKLFLILEHTGLRPGDACALRWGNCKPGMLHRVWINKTKKYIDIPVLAFQIEDGDGGWLPERPEGVADDDFIVGAHKRKVDDDGKPVPAINPDDLYREFKAAMEDAGVEHCNPYALRHLHTSRLHEWQPRHGMSPKQQADRLGNTLNQAEKAYIKALPTEPTA